VTVKSADTASQGDGVICLASVSPTRPGLARPVDRPGAWPLLDEVPVIGQVLGQQGR
jgi:hypothetical protein